MRDFYQALDGLMTVNPCISGPISRSYLSWEPSDKRAFLHVRTTDENKDEMRMCVCVYVCAIVF